MAGGADRAEQADTDATLLCAVGAMVRLLMVFSPRPSNLPVNCESGAADRGERHSRSCRGQRAERVVRQREVFVPMAWKFAGVFTSMYCVSVLDGPTPCDVSVP